MQLVLGRMQSGENSNGKLKVTAYKRVENYQAESTSVNVRNNEKGKVDEVERQQRKNVLH